MTFRLKRGLAAAGAVLLLCTVSGCGVDAPDDSSDETSHAGTMTQPDGNTQAVPTGTADATTEPTDGAPSMGTAAPGTDSQGVLDWEDFFPPEETSAGRTTVSSTTVAPASAPSSDGTGASSAASSSAAGTTKAGATEATTTKTNTTGTSGTKTTAAHGDIVVVEESGGNWGPLKE